MADISPLQCLTLEEDEITRCGQLATEGHPKPDRCKMHHGQYSILCKKYKDASKVVDNVKDRGALLTKEQIGRYTDWHAALEKARWVRNYIEAIHVERAGREIHQKRFSLKVDDGRMRRVKLLKKEMVRAVDALYALQRRAYELYEPESILDAFNESPRLIPSLAMPIMAVGDEDLIDMSLRDQKERMVMALKPFMDFESLVDICKVEGSPWLETEHGKSTLERHFFVYQQFA
ncbi:hypothetical protein OG21DRAFT_1483741 [Imleria badia]|nr:hypothetical protein OG21DRAFT_1483741 [Imleria badia]